jgi:hypothetical protein
LILRSAISAASAVNPSFPTKKFAAETAEIKEQKGNRFCNFEVRVPLLFFKVAKAD